jgi:hypothetical protein
LNWKIIDGLKAREAVIMQRMLAFNRRHMHYEPTPEEAKVFEADKAAVGMINKAIERECAARPLTRADIQEEIEAILRQEQQAVYRCRQRRR